jgi:hypothetical protein
MRLERTLALAGVALTFVGVALPPLLLLAVPALVVGLVLMSKNLRRDLRWYKEYKPAYTRALLDLRMPRPPQDYQGSAVARSPVSQ